MAAALELTNGFGADVTEVSFGFDALVPKAFAGLVPLALEEPVLLGGLWTQDALVFREVTENLVAVLLGKTCRAICLTTAFRGPRSRFGSRRGASLPSDLGGSCSKVVANPDGCNESR